MSTQNQKKTELPPMPVEELTSEQKRVQVAELLGWTRKRDGALVFYWVQPDGTQLEEATNRFLAHTQLPDYCGDLNAICHAVDVRLSNKEHVRYRECLRRITDSHAKRDGNEPDRAYLEATAEQRVEALILTAL